MRRYLPLMLTVAVIAVAGYLAFSKKDAKRAAASAGAIENNIGAFGLQKKCAALPRFLRSLKIPQPVMIDLSQKRYTGIALHYGKNFRRTLHPKQWEQYGHFSTYALDEQGNIYLVPTPYISIHPSTFNLQKNLYRLESKTGKLSLFMHFDDVLPSANNPYGLNAVAYDCDDRTLWVAAVDESDYRSQKGVIYHIDPKTKEILQRVDGFDVLSMAIVRSQKGKYLLAGSARDNGLYAFRIEKGKLSPAPQKLLELPAANERIRKIKVKGENLLELQSIPFSYALIAQSSKRDRAYYRAVWDEAAGRWNIR